MSTITLRGLSDATLRRLKLESKRAGASMNLASGSEAGKRGQGVPLQTPGVPRHGPSLRKHGRTRIPAPHDGRRETAPH